ncbi:hypothetical protein ACFU98_36595, partial [Streptomyces sp. NPDC057575]|uniref:hypothetical protein n=1 Tax=Streptomyces sp. NPDC057575 TaxID=3346170 RepID=UPI0036ABDE75
LFFFPFFLFCVFFGVGVLNPGFIPPPTAPHHEPERPDMQQNRFKQTRITYNAPPHTLTHGTQPLAIPQSQQLRDPQGILSAAGADSALTQPLSRCGLPGSLNRG